MDVHTAASLFIDNSINIIDDRAPLMVMPVDFFETLSFNLQLFNVHNCVNPGTIIEASFMGN